MSYYVAVKRDGDDVVQFVKIEEIEGSNELKVFNRNGGYCYYDKLQLEVVKKYGEFYDESIEEFLKEYGPDEQAAPCARLGFISPDGKFFPCAYCAHNDLADRLLTIYYQKTGTDYDLEKLGWCAIKANGIITARDYRGDYTLKRLTSEAQDTLKKVLFEFATAPEDINWYRQLIDNPEHYYVSNWMTPPDGGNYRDWARTEIKQRFGEEVA
jgi:hypothetical protein